MKLVRYVLRDNVLREFGARIAARRLSLNLTQSEVSDQASVPVRTIARIESGAVSTGLMAFVRICLALGLKDHVAEWVPLTDPAATRLPGPGSRIRKRAARRPEQDFEGDDAAYWAWHRWVWEP